jgi:hypothetical protein
LVTPNIFCKAIYILFISIYLYDIFTTFQLRVLYCIHQCLQVLLRPTKITLAVSTATILPTTDTIP